MPETNQMAFSMADVETQYFNELLWNKITCGCGRDPHQPKIIQLKQKVLKFSKIRA